MFGGVIDEHGVHQISGDTVGFVESMLRIAAKRIRCARRPIIPPVRWCRGAAAFDVRTADVGVARADVFVDEIGVEAVLTQPMAAPHLVKHVRKHDIR